jgi:predicted DNA-binding transcriptional regulator YafY
LAVSKSTVERDLATLALVFPLEEEAEGKQKKRYRIRAGGVPAATVGPMEFLAFDAAVTAVAPTRGGPFRRDLAALRQKVRALVASQKAMNGTQLFLPHPRGYIDYTGRDDMLDELVTAVCQHRIVEIQYRKGGHKDAGGYTIRPLALLFHGGALTSRPSSMPMGPTAAFASTA